ncbi:uncharacterized protein CANTADRAFT_26464 [Suhomyces tanzawaensis NRRL Y-17324]|uniref:Zinc metalloprotease n=1 Tax=Suhomyces tanzawaensis NRRL Y-17324 TaxID=984487 RepID=A0A1E4SFM1_9ASCO|nr:uncharacterized protein CANTADRAFT_26464 [Suhomyces tanzawaensis NRRL Y-17324]ODV78313.1 hypothetical protein CANTADRAFT_26464 [Suhomyces tanzawaensis NRRL Y-17324]
MTVANRPFVKQTSFAVDYAPSHITKWRSQTTGLQITYINQPSPIVEGYFAVATEITNDSGCPHTLEHLIFTGSSNYPYKGLLDTLGNRLYSSTNAWTGVDQTVYTLTTAGWDGFKTLLPIYLDHILHPTLTDEACLTEVYHIDGTGKEKGVVFSEMQGIETDAWSIMYLEMQRLLYAASSGYSSETGGLMAELRKLTNDQIVQFHKDMYRPDNLCVIITGSINEDELLDIMTQFDHQLPALPTTPNKRPFMDSPEDLPLLASVVKEVPFPDTEEVMGKLLMSWIGPDASGCLVNVALDMVGSFLTESPISLFNKHLVEIESPYATEIDYGTDDYRRTTLNFTVHDIPVEHLSKVDVLIKDLIVSQTDPKSLDLDYMRHVIKQQRLKFISSAEKSPMVFSNVAISEFLYGKPDGSDLMTWSKGLSEYDELLEWSAEQWCSLIKEYFVENHSVSLLGKPSIKLNDQIKKTTKQISKDIKAKYGKEGLAELGKQLDLAQEKNDTPIPEKLLTEFEKPDPSKIQFINTKSYTIELSQKLYNPKYTKYIRDDALYDTIAKDSEVYGQELPLFIHFEDFKSEFTTINLVLSSTAIDPDLLRYMSIIEEIFSLSIELPNGDYIPYEKVISNIEEDLLETRLDNGYENEFLELISVKVKFESHKYPKAIEWLQNVLRFSKFEEARTQVIIEKIINSIPDKKRLGELMMYSLQYRTMFESSSLRKAQDSMYTEEFYKDLLVKINDGKFDMIKKDLEKLTKQLFTLENLKVFVVGGISSLQNPITSWKTFIETFNSPDAHSPIPFDKLPRSLEFKSEIGNKCLNEAYLIASPAEESTHLISVTPMPTSYLEDDIFRIALTTEFLNAVEGPFWRGVRGTGLAYGTQIKRNLETGLLTFQIYRGSDGIQAWTVAKSIVDDYADGKLKIDQLSVENSVAAIVNAVANQIDTNYNAASSAISDYLFKRRGPDYTEYFIKRLNELKADDILYTLNKYFKALFSSESSVIFTSLPPVKVEETSQFFKSQGYQTHVEEITLEEGEYGSEDDSEFDSEFESETESESGEETEDSDEE